MGEATRLLRIRMVIHRLDCQESGRRPMTQIRKRSERLIQSIKRRPSELDVSRMALAERTMRQKRQFHRTRTRLVASGEMMAVFTPALWGIACVSLSERQSMTHVRCKTKIILVGTATVLAQRTLV